MDLVGENLQDCACTAAQPARRVIVALAKLAKRARKGAIKSLFVLV